MQTKHNAGSEDDMRNLIRKLRDKYVDAYGYAKKVVIDDVLNQFANAHQSLPSTIDLKNLDIVMKKRAIGKEATYNLAVPASESKLRMVKSQVSITATKNDNNAIASKGKTPSIIGKGKGDKNIELAVPEVTGKITNLPAPKPKIRKLKVSEEVKSGKDTTAVGTGPKQEINPVTGHPINSHSTADITKGMNRWGLLAMHKSQEFLAEKDAEKSKKKLQFDEYKKILDQQMFEQEKLKALNHVVSETQKIKSLENNSSLVMGSRRKDALDEQTLKNQYDSLQQEIEKNSILNPRELAIMKLQDKLSWELPRGPQGTTGQKPVSQVDKKNKFEQYKDVLDKQMLEKEGHKAKEAKEEEHYRQMHAVAFQRFEEEKKDKAFAKKQKIESYLHELEKQKQERALIEAQDMTDREFLFNKDLIEKAASGLRRPAQ